MKVRFRFSSLSALSAVRLLCVLLGMALVSGIEGCRDDLETAGPDTGRPKDSFSVSIALAGMGTEETRAPGEDSEDTNGEYGTADENVIDINDLYVMTFSIPEGKSMLDAESKLLEVIWDGPNGGKANDTGIYFNGRTAYLNTWLDSSIQDYKPDPGNDFCLVAIANFSQYSKVGGGSVPMTKGTTFSQLQTATQYNFDPKPIAGKGIPLFGVKRVNLRNYKKGIHNVANPYLLESNGNPTLWMLRAFAKVEVSLSDKLLEMEQTVGPITIESASVTNAHAANFWVIPELDRMEGFSDRTGGTGQINATPGTGFQSTKAESTVPFTLSPDKKKATIYLPEYCLQLESKPTITLSLNVGGTIQAFTPFEFKHYPSEESAYGSGSEECWKYILRNYCYRFLLDVGFNLISVVPKPWDNTFDNEFTLGTEIDITSVSLRQTTAELMVNETMQLLVSVVPAEATNKTFTWTSSDEEIASVGDHGKVTALAPGTATITVSSSNGMTATCTVTVIEATGGDDNSGGGDNPEGGGTPE